MLTQVTIKVWYWRVTRFNCGSMCTTNKAEVRKVKGREGVVSPKTKEPPTKEPLLSQEKEWKKKVGSHSEANEE